MTRISDDQREVMDALDAPYTAPDAGELTDQMAEMEETSTAEEPTKEEIVAPEAETSQEREIVEKPSEEVVKETSEETIEEPDDSIEGLRAHNQYLLDQINALAAQTRMGGVVQAPQEQAPTEPSSPPAPASQGQPTSLKPEASAPASFDIGDILSREELDRILDEPVLINIALQRGISKAVAGMSSQIDALKAVVSGQVQNIIPIIHHQIEMTNLRQRFFTENPELEKVSNYFDVKLANIIQDAQATNTDMTFNEAYRRAGDVVRKELRMPSKTSPGSAPVGNASRTALKGVGKSSRRPASATQQKPGQKAFMDEI